MSVLTVAEVFGPTLQGEGPSVGRRCAFVRLGGCNLDCSWCDTPYTWDWQRFRPDEELRRVDAAAVTETVEAMGVDMLVITGGEPLLQARALLPLLTAAAERRWRVEVETNGTVSPTPQLVPLVTAWNVSPKLANSGVAEAERIRPAALAALRATGRAVFKFVVTGAGDLDEVASLAAAHRLAPVYVMPEGTTAEVVLARMRELAAPALARGFHLTPRLHILLWGDVRGR
ncbi:MAG: 7-carboxy-7-deazaguanine synthase QueE [Chloroflexi bacterium]|nr:MAG: 7-carboxy-7-deazaguanine synthase QueE [Chloroflexota bacterium]